MILTRSLSPCGGGASGAPWLSCAAVGSRGRGRCARRPLTGRAPCAEPTHTTCPGTALCGSAPWYDARALLRTWPGLRSPVRLVQGSSGIARRARGALSVAELPCREAVGASASTLPEPAKSVAPAPGSLCAQPSCCLFSAGLTGRAWTAGTRWRLRARRHRRKPRRTPKPRRRRPRLRRFGLRRWPGRASGSGRTLRRRGRGRWRRRWRSSSSSSRGGSTASSATATTRSTTRRR